MAKMLERTRDARTSKTAKFAGIAKLAEIGITVEID